MTQTVADRAAANVRAEMARRGLQQVHVAGQLGLTRSAFSRRFRGHIPFSVVELETLASLLDVSLESLLGDPVAA
ncbi:helix-turn-helix domain-containing protein [Jatrophihabitans sp. GAS493]|uniref:helix-turn-helix domain-containing protein n=1 Tax=Jatrophihabitans sp. GAS493 TaxID=1907575 RepID=UPI000BB71298|nr:helix-turn-helix transcriptional regulator [Jatrophihabitans sp. GAS493]